MFCIVCDYSATGEGRTIMMHVVTSSEKKYAMESFANSFDAYYFPGATVVEIDEFLKDYDELIPPSVKRILIDEQNGNKVSYYFNWSQTFHFNAS